MWARQPAGPTAPAPGDAPILATSAHTARLAARWNRRCGRGCCARRRVCVLHPVPVESAASTLLDHVVTQCVQHGYAVIEQRTDPGHLDDRERLGGGLPSARTIDRKSTRLNSSHSSISYAV